MLQKEVGSNISIGKCDKNLRSGQNQSTCLNAITDFKIIIKNLWEIEGLDPFDCFVFSLICTCLTDMNQLSCLNFQSAIL